jgi:hypothetical protein
MEADMHFQYQSHGQNPYTRRKIGKSPHWCDMTAMSRSIRADRSHHISEPDMSLEAGLSTDEATRIHSTLSRLSWINISLGHEYYLLARRTNDEKMMFSIQQSTLIGEFSQ